MVVKRLADAIATKGNESYSRVVTWMRCCLAFRWQGTPFVVFADLDPSVVSFIIRLRFIWYMQKHGWIRRKLPGLKLFTLQGLNLTRIWEGWAETHAKGRNFEMKPRPPINMPHLLINGLKLVSLQVLLSGLRVYSHIQSQIRRK